MKNYELDLTKPRSRSELHTYLAEKLELPSYYGKNLDALYECMTDLTEDTCITLYTDQESPKGVLRVLRDAAEENRHLTVRTGKTAEQRAAEYVASLSEKLGRPLTACVVTFGCQMNARDSEKIRGVLNRIGYTQTDKEEDADFVIYNTCTVRENANQRVYGRLGSLSGRKKVRPHMIIGLCGCMMQEAGEAEYVREHYPFVDLIFGTYNLKSLSELIAAVFEADTPVVDLRDHMEELPEDMPTDRKYPFKSGVNITYGCNNFCTYCIVPYVRGREISRMPEEILCECRKLAEDGVKEVMLLGQNVNSYGNTLGDGITFSNLLREVEKIDGIERIRFMTSHPKDFSDELIEVIAKSRKICHHIHLPAQSGSTQMLKKMNRRYTREQYLDLVRKIRKAIPDISLTTDIIVGFPGETEEDFLDTMSLIDEVGYDSVFTFIYSKRSGTPAAVMENQVPEDVVKDRFDRLLALVHKKAGEACSRFEGETQPVLVEEKNREEGYMTGRLGSNLLVHFKGDASLIGQIVPVHLTECRGFYYIGERIPEEG